MTNPLPPFDTVSFYSKDDCPWCDKARALLAEKGITIEWEKKVGRDLTPDQFKLLASDHSWKPPTVPMIFYKNADATWTLLGGFIDLVKALKK